MEIQELPGITRFIPKILLAITVTICDEVYKKIAYWLNDMGKRHKMNSPGTIVKYYLLLNCNIFEGRYLHSMTMFLVLPNYWCRKLLAMRFLEKLCGAVKIETKQPFYHH